MTYQIEINNKEVCHVIDGVRYGPVRFVSIDAARDYAARYTGVDLVELTDADDFLLDLDRSLYAAQILACCRESLDSQASILFAELNDLVELM